MNRRQFLRAAAVSPPAAVAALSARATDGASGANTTHQTPTATSRSTTTGTLTPTPTEAVATPTSAYEPLGRVAVEGGTETVVTPDGATAFVATGDGFAAVDLSDPAEPTVVARVSTVSPPDTDRVMTGISDVKYDDGDLLVAGPASHGDGFHGVALYDVTDPTAPRFRRAHETTFPVHNCYLADGHAYLTGNNRAENPLVVVDVSRDQPRELARWSLFNHDAVWESVRPRLRTLHDVWVEGGYAYLAHWDAGTWIVDVSDPADPGYVADIRERAPEELAALDGLAAAREGSEPPGNDHYVATGGSVLAIGKESWNSNFGKEGTTPGPNDPGGPSGIDLYDISDPTAPAQLATIDPPPTADPNYHGVRTTSHNFDIVGDYLYSSWYRGGVKIHDISDPSDPERVRYFRRSSTTSFWTAQLATPGETVVATSYRNPSDFDAPGRLYTFPDVARETPTAADATTAPGGPETTSADSPTAAPTPAATGDRGPATDAVETEGTTGGANAGTTTSDGGPGFGPVATLVGIGFGAWRLLGGDTETEANDG